MLRRELVYKGLRSYCFFHRTTIPELSKRWSKYMLLLNVCDMAAGSAILNSSITDIQNGNSRIGWDGKRFELYCLDSNVSNTIQYKRRLFEEGFRSYNEVTGMHIYDELIGSAHLDCLLNTLPATSEWLGKTMSQSVSNFAFPGQEEALFSLLAAIACIVRNDDPEDTEMESAITYNAGGYFELNIRAKGDTPL